MRNKKFGKALREYMERRGMKRQVHLAKDLKVSTSMVSLYFSGKKRFSANAALRIAKKTGIPMEELFQ